MSINSVTISGNLTRDPELRMTTNGTHVMNFGVAVNDRRRNPQTQEWEDVANFIDCVVFGARAESLSRFLFKGTKVVINGKLRYSSWETDGQRRSRIEVIVDDLDFMSRRDQGQGGGGGGYNRSYQGQQSQSAPSYSVPPQAPTQSQGGHAPMPPAPETYDNDIPF